MARNGDAKILKTMLMFEPITSQDGKPVEDCVYLKSTRLVSVSLKNILETLWQA